MRHVKAQKNKKCTIFVVGVGKWLQSDATINAWKCCFCNIEMPFAAQKGYFLRVKMRPL